MELSREELKAKLIEKLSKQLDEVLTSPTVTMRDFSKRQGMKWQKDCWR